MILLKHLRWEFYIYLGLEKNSEGLMVMLVEMTYCRKRMIGTKIVTSGKRYEIQSVTVTGRVWRRSRGQNPKWDTTEIINRDWVGSGNFREVEPGRPHLRQRSDLGLTMFFL